MAEQRIGAIDELRGLAVIFVVLSHAALIYGSESDLAFGLAFPAFGVGVDLFFVISGFVIYRNVRAMNAAAGGDALCGATAFWIRRLVRIGAPAAATIAVIALMRLYQDGPGSSWIDLFSAVGFFANFHWAECSEKAASCPYPLVVSHFWSLSLEMQFYAVAPALVAMPRRLMLPLFAVVLVAGACFARPLGSFPWTTRPDAFLIGIGLAALRDHEGFPCIPRLLLNLGQAIYWACVASIFTRLLIGPLSGLGLSMTAFVFGVVLAGRIDAGASLSRFARMLRKTGEISFSAYLTHLPIMSGVHAALAEKTSPVVSLSIALAVVAAIALLWDAWIVAPSARIARRLSNRQLLIICNRERNRCNSHRHFFRRRRM